uniref:Uncharacterized protein n=1 Tax=viral metagenome TaxID=1070528 RepID=A0A6C0HM33_9ZZZZ
MEDTSLITLVRDVTYYYIKFYYEKELKESNTNKLPDDNVKAMIDNLYIEKANDLKKYIRTTLKENLNDAYSAVAVENLLIEMFNDPEYSKQRVYLEILEYQKSL